MRSAGILIAALFLASCASSRNTLIYLSPERWSEELRARGVDPAGVPNPLQVTDDMRNFALGIAGSGTPIDRLNRLQQALFDDKRFPFSYETRGTFTAAEAYYRRQGNCLSFTNLFVALGRSLRIPVTTALVTRIRSSEQEGDLIVVNTHVVAVLASAGENVLYDFDRTRRNQPAAIRSLDDLWITALYLNNRGADELRGGHNDIADSLFEDSVRLAPELGAAWGNLGVARRRLGKTSGAFEAYRNALAIEPDNPTILANLAALYASLGRREEADAALMAANMSKASAHVLVVRGYLELTRGQVAEAARFFRRARRMAPQAPEPYIALARVELSRSRPDKAERYLREVLGAHPGNATATRMLDEIRSRRSPDGAPGR